MISPRIGKFDNWKICAVAFPFKMSACVLSAKLAEGRIGDFTVLHAIVT